MQTSLLQNIYSLAFAIKEIGFLKHEVYRAIDTSEADSGGEGEGRGMDWMARHPHFDPPEPHETLGKQPWVSVPSSSLVVSFATVF